MTAGPGADHPAPGTCVAVDPSRPCGRIDPRPLISRTFPFHQLRPAIRAAAGADVIKVQLDYPG